MYGIWKRVEIAVSILYIVKRRTYLEKRLLPFEVEHLMSRIMVETEYGNDHRPIGIKAAK
jgi:hypothetical protein